MNLRMERNVVVFAGAGASAASGYAQIGEILPEALRRPQHRRSEHQAPAGFGLFLGELEDSRGGLEGFLSEEVRA